MNFQFPIWISGSAARDGRGDRLVAFSTAARAYAYLSAHSAGQVEIELVSETRLQLLLPRLQARGILELSIDPDPDGSAGMTIVLSGVEDALAITNGRRA
jgi:hypothetical protein